MAGADSVIFQIQPEPIEVKAREVGATLAYDDAEKQAAVFLAFARTVQNYLALRESWQRQCRFIARKLTDSERDDIASVLATLVDHLRAIPAERNQAR